ncbi:PP2C family protein-serine/threonine phosphatase [Cellulomonas sp. ATA003]|nr:PP2C family protein-serine/threonine phosphatase [Cellulomonas sp. ATA003]WNB87423.1 PP2C family protein-serine/threonine phosphatase [Cellulomonas sp. ATA003]
MGARHLPAEILTRLDRTLAGLGVDVLTSCLLVTVEQSAAEAAAGLRRLRWASAGHLPAALLHADGTAELLTIENGPLLGVQPDTVRVDHEHLVEQGSTLLLYTDGLVERRDRHLADGLETLRAALARHATVPLDDLVDVLVADLTGHTRHDDVAVLGVRFHPEDQPRPPDAGPSRA